MDIGAYGTLSLRKAGKPDNKRSDASVIGIEKTTELVTTGAYRYIGHPMSGSLLFGAWGIFFKHHSWLSDLLTGIGTFFAVMTAEKDVAENFLRFGDAYLSI